MALTAQMFEHVGGRHAAHSSRRRVVLSRGQSFHEAGAERVADARRVDNPPRLHGFDIDAAIARQHSSNPCSPRVMIRASLSARIASSPSPVFWRMISNS